MIFRTPTWTLADAAHLAQASPDTFLRPSAEDIANLRPGNMVKLIFMFPSTSSMKAERMWVLVESVSDDGRFAGKLINYPMLVPGLHYGDHIEFSDIHVVDWRPEPGPPSAPGENVAVLSMRHGSYSKS